jgi:hypothetical protein
MSTSAPTHIICSRVSNVISALIIELHATRSQQRMACAMAVACLGHLVRSTLVAEWLIDVTACTVQVYGNATYLPLHHLQTLR